ncbi:MAG: hypothetical protein IMZ54_11400 [Acidobacteria bacterium]|nr:hypothetical protein [Acidobacteriota bacterium]
MPAYVGKLLTAFAAEKQNREGAIAESASSLSPSLTDPLNRRELEVKRRTEAIARGRELGLL